MDCLVVAGKEIVIGFGLAGVPGISVETPEEAKTAWEGAKKAGAKIVVFSQDVYSGLQVELSAWRMTGKTPVLAVLPAFKGPRTVTDSLVVLIRQAVGMPIEEVIYGRTPVESRLGGGSASKG
jgi:vacuolar-type H+-ATPase subunit F/Vma7